MLTNLWRFSFSFLGAHDMKDVKYMQESGP